MLEVQNLSVNYRGVKALENINFKISGGELIGLIGPNGAGKSTLIKSILGLIPTSTGKILFQDYPISQQRNRIAYVPQRSQIDWDYPITVKNVVMMARTTTTGWLKSPNVRSKHLIEEVLERVEMLDKSHRQIGELSGGQQQRVFLARALAQEADLFLLDEPFTGIDKKTEALIMKIFAQLKAQGKSLLVCSHEWGEALKRYDRLLLLNQKLLANDSPEAVITLENIQKAYGENAHITGNAQLETHFFC